MHAFHEPPISRRSTAAWNDPTRPFFPPFPSVPSGRVVVAWRVNPDSGRPHVKIDWREQRGPMVATPTRYGFGSRLIERSVIQDLGGKIELTYAPDGFRCSMDLRLDRTRGAERGSIQ